MCVCVCVCAYYPPMRRHAPRIKALMSEIEIRGETNEDYSSLLAECYGCYVAQRTALLLEPVQKKVAEIIASNSSSLPGMTRAGCAYMIRICNNEQQLYGHFFSTAGPALDELLETLATVLYESLRPLFIATAINLDNLVELCSVLKSEVTNESARSDANAFLSVAEQMLQDVQQRLAYRTQTYTQSDITGYMPTPTDLDYPKKLTEAAAAAAASAATARGAPVGAGAAAAAGTAPTPAAAAAVTPPAGTEPATAATPTPTTTPEAAAATPSAEAAAAGARAGTSSPSKSNAGVDQEEPSVLSAEYYKTWYPTLPRTLLLLSKLYRSVERGAFEGLAQELVYGCLESLATGHATIGQRRGAVHGQLFLIKHLLILRDQIAPFEGSFSARETNVDFGAFFSGLRGGLQELVAQRDKLFSLTDNSLIGFLVNSTPQVLETNSDSRELMDQRLKKVCTEYIQLQTKATCGPVASFLVMLDALPEAARSKLGELPAATGEKTRAVVVEFDKLIRSKGGVIKQQLALYLSNAKTEQIIATSIKNGVLEVYGKFLALLTAGYTAEDIAIISAPSIEQVRMTFAV